MEATGIVRRIDDLGRVVIPRELRRTLKIREGDLLEIFTGRDGAVTFKKYSIVSEEPTEEEPTEYNEKRKWKLKEKRILYRIIIAPI